VADPATSDFDAMLDVDGTGPYERGPTGSRLDSWWSRVSRDARVRRAYTWGVPAVVTLTAAATRLWDLGHPRELVFDETFYVKDGWSLWNLGYSSQWPDTANEGFTSGLVNSFTETGSYVVHPPLGKWLIGAGMWLFGPENSASWRAATAIAGILAVLLLFFVAKRLFHSTLLGGIAGGLMAIEGNAIVMSRVALLDTFVMLFALLGFGAILLDREWSRGRLEGWMAARRAAGASTDWGPVLWWRPWLIAAGLAFGLTSSVKWSGFYFLAVFAVYSVLTDVLARRRAGVTFFVSGTLWRQAPASFLLTVPIAALTLLASWASWFTTSGGYGRQWATLPGNAATGFWSWVPLDWQSFWHYQVSIYRYHVGESRPHPYQANPLTWLLSVRPTSMYYDSSPSCGSDACGASITGIPNPLIWWAATAALLYLVYRLARYREWRVGLILTGMAAGYLPWLLYPTRTVFQFYSIAFEPSMILGLTLTIGIALGSRHDPSWRRETMLRLVGVFLLLAVLLSVFFWPLWTGQSIDYTYLRAHWWLPGWV
jgi:dolichyl-phosphate-mannose-protein mannosyltransferase